MSHINAHAKEGLGVLGYNKIEKLREQPWVNDSPHWSHSGIYKQAKRLESCEIKLVFNMPMIEVMNDAMIEPMIKPMIEHSDIFI